MCLQASHILETSTLNVNIFLSIFDNFLNFTKKAPIPDCPALGFFDDFFSSPKFLHDKHEAALGDRFGLEFIVVKKSGCDHETWDKIANIASGRKNLFEGISEIVSLVHDRKNIVSIELKVL